jgi:hypothetical protein
MYDVLIVAHYTSACDNYLDDKDNYVAEWAMSFKLYCDNNIRTNCIHDYYI